MNKTHYSFTEECHSHSWYYNSIQTEDSTEKPKHGKVSSLSRGDSNKKRFASPTLDLDFSENSTATSKTQLKSASSSSLSMLNISKPMRVMASLEEAEEEISTPTMPSFRSVESIDFMHVKHDRGVIYNTK